MAEAFWGALAALAAWHFLIPLVVVAGLFLLGTVGAAMYQLGMRYLDADDPRGG